MTSDSGSATERLAAARLLDRGAQAEVYEWGDGRVLRLLPADTSEAQPAREAAVMRAVLAAGVPVPAVHELLAIDGRPGMVLERIEGGPMLAEMLGRPWRLLPLVRRFGEIQAQIHEVQAPGGMRTVHEQVLEQLDRLPPQERPLGEWAAFRLEALAPGERLMHGDYHPLNLLMRQGAPVVIDWPGAAAGPPEADIARTRLLIEAADPPNGSPVTLKLLGVLRSRVVVPRYLRGYGRRRAFDRDLVARWIEVRAVERFAEAPENERAVLLKLLRASGAPI
jgi:aminoglycoside phosphotransferase (APT) family kinase protein